ncbi:hypothetical protein CHU98_g2810 [Xylaria longipes]|nr:hypothetical protein CHU98_g2810 [Xylaria longipes]
MAHWSLWSQPTSQHQQGQQEPPPSSPSIAPKTSSPSLGQPPTLPPTDSPRLKTKDAAHQEMPSPTELWQIAAKSIQTGVVTGGIGLLFGAGSGIVRSAPPTLFALFAGLQWFTLGSTYMGEENMSSSDLVKASGVAGGVSGVVGGMIRGPRNVLPGMLFFGTTGAGVSYMSQLIGGNDSNPKTSWLDSKWSPMQRLSDKDYMNKVEEKILRLDAEIAIIDDNIVSLKSSQSSVASTESTTK